MNKITKITLFSIIALFILGMALYPSLSKKWKSDAPAGKDAVSRAATDGKRQPLQVAVQIIKPGHLQDVIGLTGKLIPDEEVDLTFEVAGKITGIFFKEGSAVKKGDLLAKVNDGPLQAELKKLEAQVPLAEDRVFRQKSLLEKDAVSKEAYEQVTTDLDKLRADIELAKERIAQTELRAPFDGMIGLRQVSEGAYASPTTIIAHLTKIIPLKIEFSVPEQKFDMLHVGLPITFTVPPETYKAHIYAVESRPDASTISLKARALYPNTNGKLLPGKTTSVRIILNDIENAIMAPNEAIIAEMGRDVAYVYSGGKAKQVVIRKGLRTNANLQVMEGLQAGDTLIVSGVMQLRDGLPVTIYKEVE